MTNPLAVPAGETASVPAPATSAACWSKGALEHSTSLMLTAYRHMLHSFIGVENDQDGRSHDFVLDMFAKFKPRDPVEQMLVSQMLQTHMRLMRLNLGAVHEKNLAWAKMMYEAADRATNTFRRQMLALSEYRNPRRPKSVTTIGQANIAQQQVVQNGAGPGVPPEREDREGVEGTTPGRQGQKALPAHPQGAGGPPGERPDVEAVDAEHGADDRRGQGPVEDERAAARRAVGRDGRGKAGGHRGPPDRPRTHPGDR